MGSEFAKSGMAAQQVVSTPSPERHASQGWVAFWWDSGVVTKHWREHPSLTTGLHLHIPRAGAQPEELAFKVPENRILGKPHNPGVPEPH